MATVEDLSPNTKWDVYVQSLSVNRNVIPKQRVLVIK